MAEEQGLHQDEIFEAIVQWKALPLIADHLPVHDSSLGGRPRDHPVFTMVFAHQIIKQMGWSVRRAIREFGNPRTWAHLQGLVRATYPHRSDFWLADQPVTRAQYRYFRDTYIATDDGHQVYADAHEVTSVPLVNELGLCQVDGPGSWTSPHLTRTLRSDGVVISGASDQVDGFPIVPDDTTAEITGRHRGDPDVKSYREGGEKKLTSGHKFEFLSVRGDGWLNRVILSVQPVVDGEMATLKAMCDRILPGLPGVQVHLNDGSMRGEMLEWLMREHGVIGVAPKAVVPNEKPVHLEFVTARRPDGSTHELELLAYRGQICTAEYNQRGERVLFPLELKQHRRRGRRHSYAFYSDYQTHQRDDIRLVRGLPTAEDRQRRFNRCENYRLFPQGSETYARLYPGRNDAESIHRQYKNSLPSAGKKRSNVYRFRRVYADVLAWTIGHNALAAYIHRRSVAAAPAAA